MRWWIFCTPCSTRGCAVPSDPPLLEVRELEIGFAAGPGLVRAVDGVSFSVAPREILGIVGESGSGKTMTLLGLLGLIDAPGAVMRGSARFRGQELIGLDHASMRHVRGRQIALIPQDSLSAMTPVHTIGWQIIEQLRAHTGLSRRAARARMVELLDATGFADPRGAAQRYPHQLSGGMRQRAMIAMALSCDPALLIADEPTTALDVTVQAQILALIEKLRRDFGAGVILVTHDLGVVAEIADQVLVMRAGRVVETGAAATVFANPAHPYTRGLLAAIPPISGPRPHRLAVVE